jgi:hypothetical protein
MAMIKISLRLYLTDSALSKSHTDWDDDDDDDTTITTTAAAATTTNMYHI